MWTYFIHGIKEERKQDSLTWNSMRHILILNKLLHVMVSPEHWCILSTVNEEYINYHTNTNLNISARFWSNISILFLRGAETVPLTGFITLGKSLHDLRITLIFQYVLTVEKDEQSITNTNKFASISNMLMIFIIHIYNFLNSFQNKFRICINVKRSLKLSMITSKFYIITFFRHFTSFLTVYF